MQLGPYQLQVFTSLVVILGAAFIALICDLLKGNNEQLRELAIELKVRREEEHKRFQMMAPRAVAAPAAAEKIAIAAEKVAVAALPHVEEKKPQPAARSLAAPGEAKEKRRLAPEALAAMQRGAELAAAPRPRRAERPVELVAETAAAPQRVAEPARQAASFEPAASFDYVARPAARVEHVAEPAERIMAEMIAAAPIRSASITASPAQTLPAQTVQAKTVQAKTAVVKTSPVRMNIRPPAEGGGARDWGSLLQARRHDGSPFGQAGEDSGLLDAVVAATTSTASAQAAEPVLPAGLQDGFVLTRLVESRQPVSGLVVSIGVNAPRNEDGTLPSNVRELIESLIGPADFAAQSGAEEFLLIYPGERGAAAQRRLTQIAQQLWDFQLCALGTASILFSWGGVEVRSESIDEAIASATERMQETRRGRKTLSMESREAGAAVLARAV